MLQVQIGDKPLLNFGLIVIDTQNGFVSKNGSYDNLGMNLEKYRRIIPIVQEL